MRPPSNVTSVAPKLPAGLKLPDLGGGSHPVLIEYAGYGYADPAGPQSGIAILANLMGFTVVDVNMRGTGCSGGAFDFFEPLQSLDGYDVVETIAHQPWAQGGKVGMMGISYGGISQLFTGQTNPPDLAAISPLSVIDNVQTTLYPGGILNTGFALNWAKERVHDALPASANGGQAWAYKRIQEGDATCKANQDLHGQAVDLLNKVQANNHVQAEGGRPPVAGHVREQDQGAGVHGLPVDRRADRRALPHAALAAHRHGPQVGHLHQRHACRLARPRDVQPLVRLPVPVRGQTGAAGQLRGDTGGGARHLQRGDGDRRRDAATGPDPAGAHLPGRLAAFEKLPSIRVLFDNGAGGEPGPPGARASSAPGRASRCPAPGAARGTCGPGARWVPSPAPGAEPTPSGGTPAPGRPPT